jgi:hemerythrin-like domain-containing protein
VGRQTIFFDFHPTIFKRCTSDNTPLSRLHIIYCIFQTSHAAYYVATQMALAHNGIIRGLNSIYLQATHIPSEDLDTIRDFLTYCQCWCESMHHHHDAEETVFFPSIEQISNVQGIMERNIAQHRAFTPGFDLFQEYARNCLPKDYSGRKITSLIEDFAEPLTRHLHDEIETLLGLDIYNSGRIRQAYQRFEKSLMATDNVRQSLTFQKVDCHH